MNYKRLIGTILIVAVIVVSFYSCKKKETKQLKIGVVQIVKHTALNIIRDSFATQMEALGFIDGENCEFEYAEAQNDMTQAISIVKAFELDEKDIIIAIATPAAQAAVSISSKIPVVFSAVTDPIGAGLVHSLERTGENITGTSDALDISKLFELVMTLTPDVSKIGFLYNADESNSLSSLELVQAYGEANQIEIIETPIRSAIEVQNAVRSISEQVDAILSPSDNTVASVIENLANEAIKGKTPLYVGSGEEVEKGGLAAIGVDYVELGVETANIATKILKGEAKASEIPVKVLIDDYSIFINRTTAKAIGVTIPDEMMNQEKIHIIDN